MTYSEMIALLPEKDSPVETVGRGFFSVLTADADKKKLLEFLLAEKRYEQLFRLMYCGHLNANDSRANLGADYLAVTGENSTIHMRYFDRFVQLCDLYGIDTAKTLSFFTAAMSAGKTSMLRVWRAPSEQYIIKTVRNDYEKAWRYFRENDPDFRLTSVLLQVDKERTLHDLVQLAVYGKGVNKVALRSFLRGYKTEVCKLLFSMYASLKKTDHRVNAVRLLTLFKNDAEVTAFLRTIEETETAQSVRKLLAVHVSQKTAEVKTADRKQIVRFFYDAMVRGTAFTVQRFTDELIQPPFVEIAETLLFSVYESDRLQNIVVVETGKVHDIENLETILTSECTVKVLHPVELTSKTEFLKRLNVYQPFAQIRRKVYVPSEEDKQRGGCFGVAGTVSNVTDFTANMRKFGFRALGRDGDNACAQVGISRDGILCALHIAPIDFSDIASGSVQARCVRFYNEQDVIRLGGKRFIEGVTPLAPDRIEARAFSEFMYSIYELLGCQ